VQLHQREALASRDRSDLLVRVEVYILPGQIIQVLFTVERIRTGFPIADCRHITRHDRGLQLGGLHANKEDS